jgi:hypothetical protein
LGAGREDVVKVAGLLEVAAVMVFLLVVLARVGRNPT